ncbi:MAG: hypothetical protein M3Z28_09130 [Candidatus Dormibacteraeota bacterium]|nr:hypothetical protein [Candidatus Dormibacteraeota bacterium]
MNSQKLKDSSSRTGISRLWLGVAAVVGAAGAYLADPERGGARREAAVRQVSGATKSVTERASRLRDAVSARLSRPSEDKLPKQVSVPTDVDTAAPVKPPSVGLRPAPSVPPASVPPATQANAEPKKTGS